ncbi:putative c-terminal kinesin [Acaromyces ingoldii]|uniref:Putative c-terminal kinesin n=1 Tax=Acaromyces ingoldii TaxID=215250 RepID=A0A316YTL8_9BASI|nr:putative c-terminal kinesin [Acaromyces ingoldii]PWN91373.1 putative c-terminal kinesin [Acaromyces ingoldii]
MSSSDSTMAEQPARSSSSLSNIPVPQAARREAKASSGLPTRTAASNGASSGPSRLPAKSASKANVVLRATVASGSGSVSGSSRASTKPTGGLTLPRAPMVNRTNRPVAVGRVPSGMLPKGKVAVGPIRSAGSPGRGRISQDSNDSGRMEAIESRMTSMQDLFDMERRRTDDMMARAMKEREMQEEKVRQLEEDLLEQRRLATRRKEEATRRKSIAEDELQVITSKHNREKRMLEEELEQERSTVSALKATLAQQSTAHLTMESQHAALRTQIGSQKDEIQGLQGRIQELEAANRLLQNTSLHLESELREAESLRRKLHNEVQELRGNIRVFARVRPSVKNDANNSTSLASIRFPNEREANQIELLAMGESATGTATMRNHLFTFDRVFQPHTSQADVFEEVAHLTQSVLDGYNTCIFAYGQTGSGKTHTLEGGTELSLSTASDPSSDPHAGLIPRAVQMLWKTAEDLHDKGWRYDFEGQMLEIYNEGINDLLGKAEVDTAKHEIKHEKGRTIVTDTVVVPLDSPAKVFQLLAKAKSRRQTASTLMNERSSRSHSVFIVRVRGQNATTLESCDAVLSLVDLAGSERLSNSGSGSDPARLKEAQCINKSLSSLADVIAALGNSKQGQGHVPYRNSTLTWLLKNSLGGNSKTLMLLALSPMAEHLNESLCSLRFASKVNSTVIGTAKKVKGASSD